MNTKQILLATVLIASLVALTSSASGQITIQHEPWRSFISDTQNGYPITAKITSTAGTVNVRRVFYSINGSAYSLLFMQPTGRPDEFFATIPGQNRGTLVRYYVYAGDTAGNITQNP